MTTRFKFPIIQLSLAAAFAMSGTANADVVKIAYIDPLSGPFAPVGQYILKSWQFTADKANAEKWAGEHKFEIVGFDNKGSPMESLNQLKAAIDQGYRYIAQGSGSGVALALIDAVNKHNERNPGKEVLYINYGSMDPDMTNSKCSFWHFRFDANDDYFVIATYSSLAMLGKAFKDAKTTDPIKVASAMDGMKVQSLNGEVEMRKADHQLQQALYIATWTKVNGKDVKFDQENTGYGWKTEVKLDSYVATQPTSCQMKRPSQVNPLQRVAMWRHAAFFMRKNSTVAQEF